MRKKVMKRSVAIKVTHHTSFVLLVALAILFVVSFLYVMQSTISKNRRYAQAVATIYSDIVAYESGKDGVPVDVEHPQNAIFYGDYACRWYGIDYAYIYVPDIEKNTVTYICFSAKDDNPKKPNDYLTGYTLKRTISDEELAIINGKKVFGNISQKNQFGHQMTTFIRTEDTFGNVSIAGVSIDYSNMFKQIARVFSIIALIIVVVIIGVNYGVYLIVKKRVSKPAQIISKSMNDFITDGKRTDKKLEIGTDDEFAMISTAFNSMTDDIDNYIKNINSLTRQQEHQNAELQIAAGIQKGFLPKEHIIAPNYELRAVMTPAKNVGGDLYDYVPLDDHRVLAVIADVSGKGVSAAMFMAVTLMLIRQFAKLDLSPCEILCRTNNTLAENNSALLFATALVGIYDSNTKEFTYSNAGHNLPYVVSDSIRTLKATCGTPLGLFENEEYTEQTEQLKTGDTLFLYTDGVNEAINQNNEFYGEERLESQLVNFRTSHAENLVSYVNNALCEYVGKAEQYDDITMLTLTVKDTTELLLDLDINELSRIKQAILTVPLPRTQQLNLCLAAEECFVNICSYAFPDGVPQGEKVRFTFAVSDRVMIRFRDGGIEFNPLENICVPEDYDLDTKIGGLGKFIAVSNVDDIKYSYENGKNILTLTKYFEEENK